MKIEHPHQHPRQVAVERLRLLTAYWHAKYGFRARWNGDRAVVEGSLKGIKFSGTVIVEEERIQADIKVGFLAEKLGGRAYVRGKIVDYLNPEISLEDLQARIP